MKETVIVELDSVSENFSRREFACKCGCGFAAVDVDLIEVLETVRSHFDGRPVIINSACRCDDHNAAVGGSNASYHKKGMAADIRVSGVRPALVYEFLNEAMEDWGGVGKYDGFTHVDVRESLARWW